MSSKKRIFVVDDHPLIRKSLCDAIRAQSDLAVCGEAGSVGDAVEAVRRENPDVLVLDLNLTDGTGWTLVERLATETRLPPTLILSVNDESIYARRLLKAGARGYLMKDTPIEDILAAIRKIISGHLAFSNAITTTLIERSVELPHPDREHHLDELSDRELQVLQMISEGLTNKEISSRLKLSTKTIGTYKARLIVKTGVRTPAQLIALATLKTTTMTDVN